MQLSPDQKVNDKFSFNQVLYPDPSFLWPILKIIWFLLFNPLVPTAITQSPKDLRITQFESGIFHCKARGHPAPHIAWASGFNGDQPIPAEDRFKILPTGSLVISQVNFTDQGMYRCVASNPAGSATAAASLTVKGKSKYRIFFPEAAGYDNPVVSCSALFTCSVVYFIVFVFLFLVNCTVTLHCALWPGLVMKALRI